MWKNKQRQRKTENMAVRIKLDTLTDQQKKIIRQHLYFQPKKTNFVANKFASVEKDPVLFYWVDKPNNEIVLPYTFANSLFQKHVNSELQFPSGNFDFTGQLRPQQVEPVGKALEQLQTKGTTTLSFPTGFGKSISSIYLSSILLKQVGGIVLILNIRGTIEQGWITTIQESTNAGFWKIGTKMPPACNIILSMDGQFHKIPAEIRKMVSVLVIDEAHLFCTPSQVATLLGVCPKYIIACSATLERPDDMHRMIQSMTGKHSVIVKNNKKFLVYKLNTGIETELVKNKQGTTDFAALTRDLAFNPKRNAYIIDFIEQNKHLKIMILTWSKDHVTLLTDILRERGESVDMLAGTKSSYNDSRILVGTISKISTGFDCKNVATGFNGIAIDTLILAGSTKSHNLHIQSIGRVFRSDSPQIIELVDDNRISKSHWRERNKNYQEMNCEIREFFINKPQNVGETNEKIHAARLKAFLEKTKA